MLDYTQTHRDRELSYTIQWRVAGETELHTSYFSAGNILMALDKFFAGRDPHGPGLQRRPQPDELVVRDAFPSLAGPGEGLFKAKAASSTSCAFRSPSTMRRLRRRPSNTSRRCDRPITPPDMSATPGNSAGPPPCRGRWRTRWQRRAPIHGVLRAHDLHWSLVAVVRYFGGVKLGVGGLIEAYREAGREAVTDAGLSTNILKPAPHVRVHPRPDPPRDAGHPATRRRHHR